MNCIHEFYLFSDGMYKLSLFSCALWGLSSHWKPSIPDYASFAGGHLIWLRLDCFPTAECTEGHTVTFFGKQTGCLHVKSKREKAKDVLWTYWDAEESTSREKCFLYEKSLNIKVGEVKLATLPSSLKTPAYESVLMFFKVVTPWNKNQELLFFPPQYNKEFYLHMSWLMSALINTVQRNKSFIVPLWSEER